MNKMQISGFPDPDQNKLQPVRETPCKNILESAPCKSKPEEYPLNVPGLIELSNEWAKDDRLWNTQETVAFNLAVFGRAVLKLASQATPEYYRRVGYSLNVVQSPE